MDAAARDSGCGVPWHLLAAIARVESDFGRNMATSSAGAMGYGQFLPSSWQAFGNDGNVYDYRAALPAIATYLCASGLARDPRAALFAYNHADWYVDLVLDLAVRYDRLAPGAPIPDVLDVGPDLRSARPLQYAAGRDVKLQGTARTIAGSDGAEWLAVPWRGRAPGQPIARSALETTTVGMLRAAFGLGGDPPRFVDPGSGEPGLEALAARAWSAGLLPLRALPQERPAPALKAADTSWTMDELRSDLRQGIPMVALVASDALPGHPPNEGIGDQPIVLIGTTADGLVYSDPTFSSSLGYGLVLSDPDFLSAWEHASSPRQALGFGVRPRVLAPAPHVQEADPPGFGRRLLATPTPVAVLVAAAPLTVVATPDVAESVRAETEEVPTPLAAVASTEPSSSDRDNAGGAAASDRQLDGTDAASGTPSTAEVMAADQSRASVQPAASGGDAVGSAIGLLVIASALVCGLLLRRSQRLRRRV
jgi:hypothetical protein